MNDRQEPQAPQLSDAELEAEAASDVPDRQAMVTLGDLDPSSLLGDVALLNLNVDLALDADVAAPIDAAVAANANVAAPIDAAVSANVLSPDAVAIAQANQDSVIVQDLDGVANATANQDAVIDQGDDAAAGG
jgi:hypothetical protein